MNMLLPVTRDNLQPTSIPPLPKDKNSYVSSIITKSIKKIARDSLTVLTKPIKTTRRAYTKIELFKHRRTIDSINSKQKTLNDFNLSKKDLKRIMPYLKYADFRNCEVINEFTNEEFQKLLDSSQNLKKLFIQSEHIQSLKIPKTVTKLTCLRCDQLQSLDLSHHPNLTTFKCSGCYDLQSLDLSNCTSLTQLSLFYCPQLESLNLSNCTNLHIDNFSFVSQLKFLNLSNCTNLNKLNCRFLSHLQSLNLSNCTNLTELDCSGCCLLQSLDLSHCTNLTTLKCSYCYRLQSIDLSLFPNLTELDCSCCYDLQSLDLSNCTELNQLICSDCPLLSSLNVDALPQCQTLHCYRNPSLTQLPQLPPTAQVYSNISFSCFTVDLAKLEDDPTSILLQLGRNYLLQNRSFPNIVFKDSRLEPGESQGIDVGGLRRHLVSTLFKNLLKNEELFRGETEKKLPLLDADTQEQNKKDYFRTIGRLFALCLTSSLLTGVHFDEHLFTTIRWIIDNSDPRPDHFDKRVYCKLQGYDYDELDKDTIAGLPLSIKETPIVYPAILIAEEMKIILQRRILPQGLEFQRAIQGIEVTPDNLIDKTIFQQGSLEQRSNMQRLFENWIRTSDPEKLVTFVRFATGSLSLGDKKITIDLYPTRTPNRLPEAHSCFNILDMPIYPDQETFNNKINTALESGSAEGFQVG